VDVAMQERRADEVLRWYREHRSGRDKSPWNEPRLLAVAEALKGEHPDEAVEIWKGLAEVSIARRHPSHYQKALPHLRRVRTFLEEAGRSEVWLEYTAELHTRHARKRRFLELLDEAIGRPITEG
jgi:uncharacterized Zn finger protein